MKQTTTGLFYLDWIYYISLLNVLTGLVVIIATFSLSGARLFFVLTAVGEALLVLISFSWIFITIHKVAAFAVLVHYSSMFVAVILVGASIVALEEISTCYFADYDAFKHMADCSNLINRGTVTTFNVDSPRVCEGQSYDDSMLGMCVAAQVSVDYINVARAVGVIAATIVLLQVCSLLLIVIMYVIGLRTALDDDARIESEARFLSIIAALKDEPELLERFSRVCEYLGKVKKDDFDRALSRVRVNTSSVHSPHVGASPSSAYAPPQLGRLTQRSPASSSS